MPFNLFNKNKGKQKDGLTQPQREAITDLLHFCLYADNKIALTEEKVIEDVVATFDWDPNIAFETFEARSIAGARQAKESPETQASFLAYANERLATDAVRKRALDACQRLLSADGSVEKEARILGMLKAAIVATKT
jgi:hypothetical protein